MTRRELVTFEGLDAAHKDAVRYVYESSFPLALRAPWEEVTAGRPDEGLLALLDDDIAGHPPVGLVLYRHLGSTLMTFLRYFVVDGKRRGLGHGSAARRYCSTWKTPTLARRVPRTGGTTYAESSSTSG